MVNLGTESYIVAGCARVIPSPPCSFYLLWSRYIGYSGMRRTKACVQFLNDNCERFRFSLYVDDAAIFIWSDEQELNMLKMVLEIFGHASGLHTNLEKMKVYTIRCVDSDVQQLLGDQYKLLNFPCKYLGLPLHIQKLPRASVQPMVQKIADRLPGWKRDFFSYPGRELLVKSVLTAMPIYYLTIFKFPRWAIQSIDRYRHSFLWKGRDRIKGGQCLASWNLCTRPKKCGLGIKDLEKFNRALRLRWLWHRWDQ